MRLGAYHRVVASTLVPMTLCMTTTTEIGAQGVGLEMEAVAVHVRRALLFIEQGNHGAALQEFFAAEKIAPRAEYEYNIALANRKLGKHAESLRWLELCRSSSARLKESERVLVNKWIEEESRLVGSLVVSSNVSGASITIAGEQVAETPMSTLVRLNAGEHFVSVYKTGFVPQIRRVVLDGGKLAQEHFELVPTDEDVAELLITSTLPDIDIVVDNGVKGRTPMRGALLLASGFHWLEFRRSGYLPMKRRVFLDFRRQSIEEVVLREDTDWITVYGGHLKLDFKGQKTANITLDGVSRGTYAGSMRLAPGRHRLRVEQSGFASLERDVHISSGQTTTEIVDLDPNPDTLEKLKAEYSLRQKLGISGMIIGEVMTGVAGAGALVYASECNSLGKNEPNGSEYINHCKKWAAGYTATFASMMSIGLTTFVLSHQFASTRQDPRRYEARTYGRRASGPWLVPTLQPMDRGVMVTMNGSF